jgi:hypothetical protein
MEALFPLSQNGYDIGGAGIGPGILTVGHTQLAKGILGYEQA